MAVIVATCLPALADTSDPSAMFHDWLASLEDVREAQDDRVMLADGLVVSCDRVHLNVKSPEQVAAEVAFSLTDDALPHDVDLVLVGLGSSGEAALSQAFEQWHALVLSPYRQLAPCPDAVPPLRSTDLATVVAEGDTARVSIGPPVNGRYESHLERRGGPQSGSRWSVTASPFYVRGNDAVKASAMEHLEHIPPVAILSAQVVRAVAPGEIAWISVYGAKYGDGSIGGDVLLNGEPWPEGTMRFREALAYPDYPWKGELAVFASFRQFIFVRPCDAH